jgi:glycosyltransferase involved in cell wall biosynthesis
MKLIIDAVGVRWGGGFSILDELLTTLPLIDEDINIQLYLIPKCRREFDIKGYNFKNIKYSEVKITKYYIGRFIWQNLILPFIFYKNKYDHLFTFYNYGSFFIARQTIYFNTYFIFDDSIYEGKKRIKIKLIRFLALNSFKYLKNIIVQTSIVKDEITLINKSLENKIFIIPGGYHFKNTLEPKNAINFPMFRLIYIVYPHQYKNFDVLVDALAILNKGERRKIKLCLTLYKEASLYKYKPLKKETERIIELAKAKNVYKYIEWLGVLGKSEVMEELNKSDMLVFPSLCETFGLPLVEAISVNKPIVAADLPYAREVAKDCAVYFQAHDAQDLADKILSLYNDNILRESLVKNCNKYKDLYSYMNISREIISLFRK